MTFLVSYFNCSTCLLEVGMMKTCDAQSYISVIKLLSLLEIMDNICLDRYGHLFCPQCTYVHVMQLTLSLFSVHSSLSYGSSCSTGLTFRTNGNKVFCNFFLAFACLHNIKYYPCFFLFFSLNFSLSLGVTSCDIKMFLGLSLVPMLNEYN